MKNMNIINIFNKLELILSNKSKILKRDDVATMIIKGASISVNKHIPLTFENLLKLWTENTCWTIHRNDDVIYIYKMKKKENNLSIKVYGWSKNTQKPIVLQGQSYHQLYKDAIKIGVQLPNSTVHIDDAIEVLRKR